jgi:hypothetical protein
MPSHAKASARIETRTAEDVATFPNLEAHEAAVESQADCMAGNIRDQAIADEQQAVKPDPAKKRK